MRLALGGVPCEVFSTTDFADTTDKSRFGLATTGLGSFAFAFDFRAFFVRGADKMGGSSFSDGETPEMSFVGAAASASETST